MNALRETKASIHQRFASHPARPYLSALVLINGILSKERSAVADCGEYGTGGRLIARRGPLDCPRRMPLRLLNECANHLVDAGYRRSTRNCSRYQGDLPLCRELGEDATDGGVGEGSFRRVPYQVMAPFAG